MKNSSPTDFAPLESPVSSTVPATMPAKTPVTAASGTTSIAESCSVDPREVEKFNKLAATWWDASGPMWPLHRLNRLRSTYIVQRLIEHFKLDAQEPEPLAGLRILDIGCGGGLLSEAMATRGAEVHLSLIHI